MNSIIVHSICPGCGSTDIRGLFTVKDFTVSGEEFPIWGCGYCNLRFTQNIPDSNSIGKYYKSEQYISHTDTSKGLINRLYHLVRKRTLKLKRELITKTLGTSTGQLLDIGAGTGAFAAFMQENGWQVTGLEPDQAARESAFAINKVSLLPSEALFSLPDESFDAITLWHVLEHVHQLHEYLEQIRKLLKRNGRIFIAVPNYTSADAESYKEYWAAYDVPRHLYHFSPKSMQVILEKHQMQIDKTIPMWFDSFYVSMLSEKYKRRRITLIRGSIKGFASNLNTLFNRQESSSLIYIISRS